MLLSEHVYCVAVTFKMTEQVEQWICIRFCIKFIPQQKLFRWFKRPQLWATGDWQLHYDYTPVHASRLMQSFLVKHKITQVTQPSYSPDLVPCDFWLFPKLKWPLKEKRFQTIDEIQKNIMWQLMAIGRTVWVPRCLFEEDWGSIVLCTMFLVSSSINDSIFHITWLDTFWTGLI